MPKRWLEVVKRSVAIIDFGGLLGKKKYTYKQTQKHQCSLWAFVRTEGKQKIFLWSDRSNFKTLRNPPG